MFLIRSIWIDLYYTFHLQGPQMSLNTLLRQIFSRRESIMGTCVLFNWELAIFISGADWLIDWYTCTIKRRVMQNTILVSVNWTRIMQAYFSNNYEISSNHHRNPVIKWIPKRKRYIRQFDVVAMVNYILHVDCFRIKYDEPVTTWDVIKLLVFGYDITWI